MAKYRFSLRKTSANAVFVFLLATAFFSSGSAQAQLAEVYINGGVSHTVFLRKGEVKIDNGTFAPTYGFGFGFYVDDKQKWKIKSDFKYMGRGFEKSFSQTKFKFQTWGLAINALGEYPLSEKLSVEAGIGVYFYQAYLLENELLKRLGDQVKTVDLNLIVGVNYQLYKPFYIGFRTNFGVIPMVSVKPVGKYGEMHGKKQFLNALMPELYLEIKLYRRNKE